MKQHRSKQLFSDCRALLTFGLFALLFSCQPDHSTAFDPLSIEFSKDTIYLDTVFNAMGSSTRSFTIRNKSDQNILLDKIKLGMGDDSPFRFNINGIHGVELNDIILPASDSLWVFIELTSPPGALEMLWTDSLIFTNKGLSNDVKLISLAYDAHFHFPNKIYTIKRNPPLTNIEIPYSIVSSNSTWSNDKPHVVYGYAVIDSGSSLEIMKEASIHFHSGSGLWVASGGILHVDQDNTGSYSNPVVFEGDRLEPFYSNIAGQWGGLLGGIFIQRGSKVKINNAWIKNGTIGIRCDSIGEFEESNLLIRNTRITDFSRVTIYSGFGNIEMENVTIANSGLYSLYCLGGRVFADHCTFMNEFPSARSTPSIGLFNRYEDALGQYRYRDLNEAYFGNCIISGNKESEIGFDFDANGEFNYKMEGSLIKLLTNPVNGNYDINNSNYFKQCVFNKSPNFILPKSYNFQLDSNSEAIDIGMSSPAIRVPFDPNNVNRTITPDAGTFEKN
jgi:hypothetical protein